MAKEQTGIVRAEIVKAPARDDPTRRKNTVREFAEKLMALEPNDGKAVESPGNGGNGGTRAGVATGIGVALGRRFESYRSNGTFFWVRTK